MTSGTFALHEFSPVMAAGVAATLRQQQGAYAVIKLAQSGSDRVFLFFVDAELRSIPAPIEDFAVVADGTGFTSNGAGSDAVEDFVARVTAANPEVSTSLITCHIVVSVLNLLRSEVPRGKMMTVIGVFGDDMSAKPRVDASLN